MWILFPCKHPYSIAFSFFFWLLWFLVAACGFWVLAVSRGSSPSCGVQASQFSGLWTNDSKKNHKGIRKYFEMNDNKGLQAREKPGPASGNISSLVLSLKCSFVKTNNSNDKILWKTKYLWILNKFVQICQNKSWKLRH